MMLPNLATRPFLNTRPVWLVVAAAATIAVVLAVLNVRLYLISNEALGEQIAKRDVLLQQKEALEDEVGSDISVLDRVRWSALSTRVGELNIILAEHAFSWLQLLDDVGDVMPYAVRLISIGPRFDDDGSLELEVRGVSRDRDTLLEFLDRMIADPRFAVPMISSEKTPESSSTAGYSFVFSVQYEPSAGRAAS
jgi:hypothetical protein